MMRIRTVAVALVLSAFTLTRGAAGAAVLPPAPTPAESFDVGTLHVGVLGRPTSPTR